MINEQISKLARQKKYKRNGFGFVLIFCKSWEILGFIISRVPRKKYFNIG